MNLNEQIGALEASVDRINELNRLAHEALAAAAESARAEQAAPEKTEETEQKPTLRVSRPSQDAITLAIGEQSVALQPEQIGQLIEELANARASMTPEPPMAIAPGWRFAATRNPVMAVQKQANGDRLLIARHTGHGWVPFTLSPDAIIQLYMMLSK
ncbi:hypothetical protein WKR88_17305 [Trinickia caryophylli]|uniref:Phage tail protein n=1 Tax=Trinickia caryophylli TaxID=28094 RepID=A0A1X7G3A1_TRICW|nr:hypothetical protein [Trinickia caryophylli]PMS13927.1 hypothetical protein C0Z17_02345 [Trinickia caryophylli]TRX14240.1 hypothetical protein FNF07_23335 [Trinickia caryophylli]WQE14067.1 hypothetical protein U0034_25545 [Trinickia caryophylli]SMF63294.1 hypothetical protein SAMN06295900_11387 [Trinickia caryophylli]